VGNIYILMAMPCFPLKELFSHPETSTILESYGLPKKMKKYTQEKKESHSKLLSKVYTIKRSCGRKLILYVVLYWGIILRETMAWASGKVLVQQVVVILLLAISHWWVEPMQQPYVT
jgi:hypothetical protein